MNINKLILNNYRLKLLSKLKGGASKIGYLLLSLIVTVILGLSLRGTYGNPNAIELQSAKWRNDGVFEVSPERGRFGLLYSLAEDKSFYFSVDIARFIVPDLGYKNGNYVSLFAPAISFITMPGYFAGKLLGASQVGTFAVIAIFALINTFLIYKIAFKLGANRLASTIAGLTFLFATPAYAYAVNLYQHHLSSFLILMAFYLLISFRSFWSFSLIWLLCAMAIPVDYPNLFLMFPIGLVAFFNLFQSERSKYKFTLRVKPLLFLSVVSIIIPLGFFLWFNKMSYGDPMQFSGTVGSVHEIDPQGKPSTPKRATPQNVDIFLDPDKQEKVATSFFKSRNMLNGLYLHVISPDRGTLYFAPVIFFSISGAFVLYRRKNRHLSVLLGVIGANLFLYSMWGDPWGGWSFGSRYLIPAYAVASILLAFSLTEFRRNILHNFIFIPVLIFSIWINTLGAITTSANPPKIETPQLSQLSGKIERYSFDRNWEYLNTSGTKTFMHDTFLYRFISPLQYYYILGGTITFIMIILSGKLFFTKNEKSK